eukprot:5091981-Prymnesium_polylepis.1
MERVEVGLDAGTAARVGARDRPHDRRSYARKRARREEEEEHVSATVNVVAEETLTLRCRGWHESPLPGSPSHGDMAEAPPPA